ncbi:MAG: FtsX-like permease family protein, partial [Planctomycetota bacterium]
LSEIESFGARSMWIWGTVPREKRTTMSWSDVKISRYEAQRILDEADAIERLTLIANSRYDVQSGPLVQSAVQVMGVWPDWHQIEDRAVIFGRPLSRLDNEEARPVCLVNDKAIEELGLNNDPTGQSILVKNYRFLIIGVLETEQASGMFGGGEARSELVVPFETAMRLDPYDWVHIQAQMTSTEVADEARASVRLILRKIRNLKPEDEDTFGMEILQNHIEQFNQMAGVITLVAGGVVSISLLVGGIGIMNIMLVSVSERTREIGLRKAVGARPMIVLMQFLVEAVVLCVAGGLIGVLIGFGLTAGLKAIPNGPFADLAVPGWAVALSFAFSGGTGVIFGMFPAIKAARLDPIDALRHE